MGPAQLYRSLEKALCNKSNTLSRETLVNAIRRYYWVAVGILVGCGVLAMGRPFFRRHGYGPPLPHNDSVILEYVGWFIANGHTLYTDIWEIKPPLAFFPPYVFAQITGTNMYAHHLLGIATTTIGLAVTAALTAHIVGEVTDSPIAGIATGLVFFALPDLFYLPWLGYKAKMMVYVFGMAGLDRAVSDRYFSSGVLAGLAVGFWQLAIVFPILTTIYAVQRKSSGVIKRHLLGGGVAIGIIGLSVLLYADIGGFLAEVILGPIVLNTDQGAFNPRTYVLFFHNDIGRWITVAGAGGLVLTTLNTGRYKQWPLAVGGILVTGIIVFIDFDGLWDMVFPLVFTAVGVGILISYLPREVGIALIIGLALVLVPTFAASEFIRQDPVQMEQSDGLPPSLDPEREHVYWTHQKIKSCRFFGGGTQRSLLKYYPGADRLAEAPCGDLGRYWKVTQQRLLGGLATPLGGGTENSANVTTTPPSSLTIADSGIEYQRMNHSVVVTVPLVNPAEKQLSANVVVEVSAGDNMFTQCKATTLAADARTTLRYRFSDVPPGSLSLNVWITNDKQTPSKC